MTSSMVVFLDEHCTVPYTGGVIPELGSLATEDKHLHKLCRVET